MKGNSPIEVNVSEEPWLPDPEDDEDDALIVEDLDELDIYPDMNISPLQVINLVRLRASFNTKLLYFRCQPCSLVG